METLPCEMIRSILDYLSIEDLVNLGGTSRHWDHIIGMIIVDRSQKYIDSHDHPLLRRRLIWSHHITGLFLKTHFPDHDDVSINKILQAYFSPDGYLRTSPQNSPSSIDQKFLTFIPYISSCEIDKYLLEALYVQSRLNKYSFNHQAFIWGKILDLTKSINIYEKDYLILSTKLHNEIYQLMVKYSYWEKK